GLVVIATIAELPDTNHFLLEGLVDDVVQNRFVKLAREEIVHQQFKQSQFGSVTVRIYQGQLVAWSHK
ncbi:MAG: hypothetical protein ACXAE3_15715, partial [Candidatus Kariarchaeaceae archaeon]